MWYFEIMCRLFFFSVASAINALFVASSRCSSAATSGVSAAPFLNRRSIVLTRFFNALTESLFGLLFLSGRFRFRGFDDPWLSLRGPLSAAPSTSEKGRLEAIVSRFHSRQRVRNNAFRRGFRVGGLDMNTLAGCS